MKLDLGKPMDLVKFRTYSEKLVADQAKCELKIVRNKRSLDQNAYFHVVVSCFCAETGYTLQEAKTLLKRNFGSFMVYEKDNNRFLRTSADLDTAEMTEFIEWIRTVACYEQLGIYVPTSEEYITHQFDIEKQIEHVK